MIGLSIKDRVKRMKKIRVSATVKFLITVCVIYLVASFFDPRLVGEAVINTGETFIKIVPILALVFGVIYLINRYLDVSKLQKHIGKDSGLRGWLYAAVAGILISGPPYVLYPLFGDLQKKGMRNALVAVLLYNRNVKIPFIPVMIYYFGTAFTVIVSVYIILFSFVNGWLVELLAGRRRMSWFIGSLKRLLRIP
jgi:uncharacterized membrane protein YraQ (UPF0718 family)